LAPLIIHFANGRRQDKTFRKFIGAPQCHHSSFKLSFSLACSRSYRVAKKDQGSIGKGGGGKRKCPICKIQRRVGNSSFSLPFLPPRVLGQFIRDSVRILRAIVSREHDLYFLQFFFSKSFFTPQARAGFIELIPNITPYNLPNKMEKKI